MIRLKWADGERGVKWCCDCPAADDDSATPAWCRLLDEWHRTPPDWCPLLTLEVERE